MQPNVEIKTRIECLKIAQGCADPETGSLSVSEVIKQAETIWRYVTEGTVPASITKVVDNAR